MPLITYSHGSSKHFTYKNVVNRKMGAFRLVGVSGLLNKPKPVIEIYQHPAIVWGRGGKHKALLSGLKYVAISHVWDHADEVHNEVEHMSKTERFSVDIDPDDAGNKTKPLSWKGLKQMAQAVKLLGFNYFWLDFLCLDQQKRKLPGDQKDMEKPLLICMMSDIYELARNVVVMVHGVGAVWDLDVPSPWMDRAWTLQESVVNWQNTLIYVRCPKNLTTTVTDTSGPAKKQYVFRLVPKADPDKAKSQLFLISLVNLLDLADMSPPPPPPTIVPTVAVLSGVIGMNMKPPQPSDSPRRALRAAITSSNPLIQYTGVWRSMFMRTSSQAVDVVYSIMGIFRLKIDPYRKNRTPSFVFNDLARKTAAVSGIGPAWLALGGVTGSDIPRDPASGIVFCFPHYEKANQKSNNKPPMMRFNNGKTEWVGYHVDDSPYYLSRFDIRFLTQSHPHIINATMLTVTQLTGKTAKKLPQPGGVTGRKMIRYAAQCRIGAMRGTVVYAEHNGRLGRGIKAVLVGDVGAMAGHPRGTKTTYKGWKFLLFFRYENKAWKVVADGVFHPRGGWRVHSGTNRVIFTVGEGAQTQLDKWPTKSTNWVDRRRTKMQVTYGIDPLPDVRMSRKAERDITWFGLTGHINPSRGWKTYQVSLDLAGMLDEHDEPKLDRLLARPRTMLALSILAPKAQLPRAIETDTPYGIIGEGDMKVAFSYDGWSKSQCADLANAGVDGVLIPHITKGHVAISYYQAQIEFGEHVMYIQMRPNSTTRRSYWQMCVVPYSWGPGVGRKFVNASHIIHSYSYDSPHGGFPAPHLAGINPNAPGEDASDTMRRWRLSNNWMRDQKELQARGIPVTGRNIYQLARERIANGQPGW